MENSVTENVGIFLLFRQFGRRVFRWDLVDNRFGSCIEVDKNDDKEEEDTQRR